VPPVNAPQLRPNYGAAAASAREISGLLAWLLHGGVTVNGILAREGGELPWVLTCVNSGISKFPSRLRFAGIALRP
jgi:hypothetical protein